MNLDDKTWANKSFVLNEVRQKKRRIYDHRTDQKFYSKFIMKQSIVNKIFFEKPNHMCNINNLICGWTTSTYSTKS